MGPMLTTTEPKVLSRVSDVSWPLCHGSRADKNEGAEAALAHLGCS
jgi:hypothetical protein